MVVESRVSEQLYHGSRCELPETRVAVVDNSKRSYSRQGCRDLARDASVTCIDIVRLDSKLYYTKAATSPCEFNASREYEICPQLHNVQIEPDRLLVCA